MKRTPKVILAVLLAFSVIVAALWLVTEGPQDWQRERTVRSLVAAGASQQQVAERLKLHFTDLSIGSPDRPAFESYLAGANALGLRERFANYPGVWYHTTMWTMTYLFFDADGRLRDYYTCAQ